MFGFCGGALKRAPKEGGQSFVELALALPFMLLLVMGVVDLGFVFYAHVQVAAATGEASRVAAHFKGDATATRTSDNDSARLTLVQNAVHDPTTSTSSLGLLQPTSPYFDVGSDVWIDTDNTNPGGVTRSGEQITVHVLYNQPVLFGIIPGLNGMRFTVSNSTTVRVP